MLLDAGSTLILMLLIFFGTGVSAFAGFAGLGGAGAVLLHVLPPQHVIPLIMLCSIATQASCLFYLRPSINWRMMAKMAAGGLTGLPIALHVLPMMDGSLFRLGFGWLLVAYACYMLLSMSAQPVSTHVLRQSSVPLVGFAGGLVGGMTAMPGAVPTLWCDLHGVSRLEQRGIVQPFMLVIQVAAILLLWQAPDSDVIYWNTFAIVLPAVAAGTWVGLTLFRQVDGLGFRRAVLVLLMLSGATLIF